MQNLNDSAMEGHNTGHIKSVLPKDQRKQKSACSGPRWFDMVMGHGSGQPTRIIAAHTAGITSVNIADMDVTRYVTSSDKTLRFRFARNRRRPLQQHKPVNLPALKMNGV